MSKNVSEKKRDRIAKLISSSKSRVKKYLPIDTTLFIFQFFRHPNAIGALTPSSVHLAQAMTRFIKETKEDKKKYLEVGAGTGAFTQTLIDKLTPKDHLDIIEINPKFCDRLRLKYQGYTNISIHVGSVLDWSPSYKYDTIVSSLPFNAFQASFVSRIYQHYQKLVKPGGYLSYCEYMALPGIRKIFMNSQSRKFLQSTLDVTSSFEDDYEILLDKVFVNLPPAVVHHCRFS